MFGPITVQQRIDHAASVMSWAAAHLPDTKPTDFLIDWEAKPAEDEEGEPPGQSTEDMIAVMHGLQAKGK